MSSMYEGKVFRLYEDGARFEDCNCPEDDPNLCKECLKAESDRRKAAKLARANSRPRTSKPPSASLALPTALTSDPELTSGSTSGSTSESTSEGEVLSEMTPEPTTNDNPLYYGLLIAPWLFIVGWLFTSGSTDPSSEPRGQMTTTDPNVTSPDLGLMTSFGNTTNQADLGTSNPVAPVARLVKVTTVTVIVKLRDMTIRIIERFRTPLSSN